MENLGILKWRAWSIVRKAQVIGAIAGACVTAGVFVLALLTGPRLVIGPVYISFILISYPSYVFFKVLGLPLSVLQGEGLRGTLSVFCILTAVNSALSFLFGALIGNIAKAWCARASNVRKQ